MTTTTMDGERARARAVRSGPCLRFANARIHIYVYIYMHLAIRDPTRVTSQRDALHRLSRDCHSGTNDERRTSGEKAILRGAPRNGARTGVDVRWLAAAKRDTGIRDSI